MTGDIDQGPRLLAISTALGPTAMVLRRLQVVEQISRPYLIQAEVISTQHDIRPEDIIGTTASFRIARQGAGMAPRFFHGIVNRFTRLGRFGTQFSAYALEAVPGFWQLSRKANCRVFQNETVNGIIQTVMGEAGLDPATFVDTPPSTQRPYCTQYNETDLDFLQRLMDELGAGYFFTFTDSAVNMRIAQANADFPALGDTTYVLSQTSDFRDAIAAFTRRSALQPGAVAARDYNQIKPAALFDDTELTASDLPNDAGFEMYYWPGGQHTRPDAAPVLLGMQGFEAQEEIEQGKGHDPAHAAGLRIRLRFSLEDDPRQFLLTRVVHSAHDETQITEGGGQGYSSALTMMPNGRPFRPANPRPRPMVPGLQSATVTGPKPEEIHTDQFGRIKIRFHWDRLGPTDDGSSIFVRVAQAVAGKWGGTFFLPRVGDEVLVAFMDGDPDKPVVVGSLYNEDAPPPFTQPANKNQSGYRTRSTKKGGPSEANIIRIDDTQNREEFYLQAERNMNVLVKADRGETIGDDDTLTVKKGDKNIVVEEGDYGEFTQKGDYNIVVNEGDSGHFVDKGDLVTVVREGDMNTFVEQGDYFLQVKQGDQKTVVAQGNVSHTVSLGKMETSAMQSIEFKVGSSSIKLDPTGVTIKGIMVTIEATGMLKTSGPLSQHEASGVMIIKGGVVMIN